MARKGEIIEVEPRSCLVHGIDVLESTGEHKYRIRVRCGKGVYIRTLCHDIGAALGCGGCMSALRRTAIGAFSVENAITISEAQRLADQAQWISYGPARKSSAGLVGLYHDGETEMAPHMPTNPENMKNALGSSFDFWVDHETELTERFNAWLAGG